MLFGSRVKYQHEVERLRSLRTDRHHNYTYPIRCEYHEGRYKSPGMYSTHAPSSEIFRQAIKLPYLNTVVFVLAQK